MPNEPDTGSTVTNKTRKLPLARATGILFIGVAVAIALLIQCPSKAQYFIIYALIGLGIAFLLTKSADKSTAALKIRNIRIALAGGVALPFILFFTNPIGSFKPDNCDLPVSLTVFVHGKKGPQDLVLRQKGFVMMDILKKEKREAAIDEKGEAHFENMKIGDRVLLNIDFSEPYKALYPDSQYVIAGESAIYMPVVLEGIDKVKGKVMYKDSFLAGVTVQIGDLVDTTNKYGDFTIPIPEAQQRSEYKAWFIKDGFITQSQTVFPQSGPAEVSMQKQSKQ